MYEATERQIRGGRTKWVLGKVVAFEIRLEQRAHLSIAWTGLVQDHIMDFEGCHKDKDRDDDKAEYSRSPMSGLVALLRKSLMKE